MHRVAVMPDVHLADPCCNGVVLATTGAVYPQAVGGDIGCGMAALAFDFDADVMRDPLRAARVLLAVQQAVPVIRHRRESRVDPLPGDLEERPPVSTPLVRLMRREGRAQFGTLGRGNHFVEFQADEEDRLWVMLHSGSRVMGQAILAYHLERAPRAAGFGFFDPNSAPGRAYLADHAWALRYAAANRRRMLDRTVEILGSLLGVEAVPATRIHCHHNYLRRETHGDRMLTVHRKGALSAAEGEWGVIPGSMGAPSYHVVGRGNTSALRSCSHGAGRALSRSEARRRFSLRHLDRQMGDVLYDHRNARRLLDEAPEAYKDIAKVMRAQKPLVKIRRRLRPLLSYKG